MRPMAFKSLRVRIENSFCFQHFIGRFLEFILTSSILKFQFQLDKTTTRQMTAWNQR